MGAMKALVTRDSTSAGDDLDEPHCRRFAVSDDCLWKQRVVLVWKSSDLPGISGGRAKSDRLLEVRGHNGAQERLFNRDNRGFLRSEKHPEVGTGGNGTIHYTYDASGNVLSKDIGSAGDFSLRYAYDAANRLIAVDEVTSFSPTEVTRPIKRFEYARGNDDTDLRAGKLSVSKRFNWVDIVSPLAEASGSLPVIARVRATGEAGEASVRSRFNIGTKGRVDVPGTDRSRIPDGITDTAISEVKNVKRLGFTRQLRDFVAIAKSQSKQFLLFVREETKLTGPLAEAIESGDIIIHFIP